MQTNNKTVSFREINCLAGREGKHLDQWFSTSVHLRHRSSLKKEVILTHTDQEQMSPVAGLAGVSTMGNRYLSLQPGM